MDPETRKLIDQALESLNQLNMGPYADVITGIDDCVEALQELIREDEA